MPIQKIRNVISTVLLTLHIVEMGFKVNIITLGLKYHFKPKNENLLYVTSLFAISIFSEKKEGGAKGNAIVTKSSKTERLTFAHIFSYVIATNLLVFFYL